MTHIHKRHGRSQNGSAAGKHAHRNAGYDCAVHGQVASDRMPFASNEDTWRGPPPRFGGVGGSDGDGSGPPGDIIPVTTPRARFDKRGATDHPHNGPATCTCGQRSRQYDTLHDTVLSNGTYQGGNHKLALDLRIDASELEVVSGDLFGTDFGQREYLASFRTLSSQLETGHPLHVVFEGRDGHVLTGQVMIAAGSAPHSVSITLRVDGTMPGLPAMSPFDLSATWKSAAFRNLALEIEQERGTVAPPAYTFGTREMTLHSALEDAGFAVHATGQTTTIQTPEHKWGTEQLHSLMQATSNNTFSRAAWQQNLLWLGRPARAGLLGVMFDTSALLPRQGSAVFDGEIRRYYAGPDADRKVIQTTVHEIGHALNLAHRFEREVGHADSTSFMNYPQRYRGGHREAEFWKNFAFTFDEDELKFLRHGARNSVIPGGAAFHSTPYWEDGNGGYVPYAPEEPLDILDLRLTPPTDGTFFEFGQPVLLQVSLTNRSHQTFPISKRMLDPKGNFLGVVVRRVQQGVTEPVHAAHFHPIMTRMMETVDEDIIEFAPGDTLTDNLNITYGASGFTFAEPGSYDVQVFGSVFINNGDNDPDNDRELIAPSNKLRIHVAHPHTMQDEHEALTVLFREDVGTYFALGGSAHLAAAHNDLQAVYKRRMHRRKTVSDPIAANILRCQGIDAGRWSLTSTRGQLSQTDGSPQRAVALLSELEKGGGVGLRTFDPETARTTRALLAKHQSRMTKPITPKQKS